jgi:hypothetical protein
VGADDGRVESGGDGDVGPAPGDGVAAGAVGPRVGHEEVAAAAEAMRRILVENARRKGRWKRGGLTRRDLDEVEPLAAPEIRSPTAAPDRSSACRNW